MYTVKTPDDGQRNCPKHVEFCSKNKFEKLIHLFGFILRIGVFHISRRILRHYFPKHRNFGLCDTLCFLAGRNWTFSVTEAFQLNDIKI